MTSSVERRAASVSAGASTSRPVGETGSRPGVGVALRWEVHKLLARRSVQAVLVAVVVLPSVVVGVLVLQPSAPTDSLFGRWVHTSGFAPSLVLLGFCGQWVLPLLVSLVAGDLMSSERHHGTWQSILTRSMPRSRIVLAKIFLAGLWAALVVLLLGLSSTVTGLLLVRAPALASGGSLPGLDGTILSDGAAARAVAIAWATQLGPALAFAALALLLSALSRSSAVGIGGPAVLGLTLQLAGLVPSAHAVRPYLLTTGFEAWHGVLGTGAALGPWLLASLVSLAWLVASLGGLLVRTAASSFDRP